MHISATGETISEFFKSLAKAQSEVENATKTASNPHFRSKYADLAEIINTVRPVFTANGLSIIQSPTFKDGICSVETVIMHVSGAWLSDTCSAPVSKMDAQGIGSVITYLRRYSLAAFCFIAQEDDDGNAASKNPPPQRYPSKETYPSKVMPASVAEPADAVDSKPTGEIREGSIPSAGTTVENKVEQKEVHKFTVADWAKLADARKKTGEVIGREITDEVLTDFGHARFGKDSKKYWSKTEYDMCMAWMRTMYKEKEWIDYISGD